METKPIPELQELPKTEEDSWDRKKANKRVIENGLLVVLDDPKFGAFEKRQFVDIVDNLDMKRKDLARKLKISPATLTNRISTLKKLGLNAR